MFDFSENQVVEKLEVVPEDFRGLYIEGKDGKFKLDSDHAGVKSAVVAISGLNTALRASRAETKSWKGKSVDLGPLSDFGSDPAEIKTGFESKLADAIKTAGKGKGEDVQAAVSKVKEAMGKEHLAALDVRDKREFALTGQLHKLLVTGQVTSALADAKAKVELAKPHVVKHVKVVESDGEFAVRIMDSEDQERFSGVTGKHMTIKELVEEMKTKDDFSPLFNSEAPSGGGGKPSHRIGGPAPTGKKLSPNDKIQAGLEAL